jgi:hypothetical protein
VLKGALSSSGADELVFVDFRRCSETSWSVATTAKTDPGGNWAAGFRPTLSGLVRARWQGSPSRTVPVQVRPYVTLDALSPPWLKVEVGVGRYLVGKLVFLELFSNGTWKRAASTRLARERSMLYAISSGRVRLRAPAGTQVRAVVPGARCYLRGVSRLERVG